MAQLLGEEPEPTPSPTPIPKQSGGILNAIKKMLGLSGGYIPNFIIPEEQRIRLLIRQARQGSGEGSGDVLWPQILQWVGQGRSDNQILGLFDQSSDNMANYRIALSHLPSVPEGYPDFNAKQPPSIAQLKYGRFILPPVDQIAAQQIERRRARQFGIYSIDLVDQRVHQLIQQYGSHQFSEFIKSIDFPRDSEKESGQRLDYPAQYYSGYNLNPYSSTGLGANYPSNARGFIPNFAAIDDAMYRESTALNKRGIIDPLKYLFVGQSNGILGVGNTLDEKEGLTNPNAGIQQGINRYVRAGRNPRTAGRVPNYAIEDNNTLVNSFTTTINTLTTKLTSIFDKPFFNDPKTSTAGGADVKHTGNFKVDLAANISGGGGLDKNIIDQIQQAVSDFKADITQRLSKLEASNGQILNPPSLASAGTGGNNFLL